MSAASTPFTFLSFFVIDKRRNIRDNMLADQTMLEVSSSHITKLRDETQVTVEVLSLQLKRALKAELVDLLYRCLVTGNSERRRLFRTMTGEPQSTTTSSNAHFKEMIEASIDEDLQLLLSATAARLNHVARIQLQYCTDVFVPAVTDAHRFVVDRELKEIFDQLRLQQALKAQELEVFGGDIPVTAVAARVQQEAPRSPLVGSLHEAEFQLVVEPSLHARPPAPNRNLNLLSLSRNASMRRENSSHSMAGSSDAPSSPLNHTKKASSTVIPQRDHLAAMQESLLREKELHAKLDAMNRALMERAAKERETVQLLQHQMEEAQRAATADIHQKLVAFEAELRALGDTNALLVDRLQKTCEVAYVLDELCGKLNCEVMVLKGLLTEAGVASVVHHRVEKAMESMRTTLCCKGAPLVVESSHWTYGEAPDTLGWMRELTVGSKAIPTVACLSAQHALLSDVLDALSIKEDNALLRQKVETLERRAATSAEEGLRARHDTNTLCNKRVAMAETQNYRLMEENNKLRLATARLMELEAARPDAPRACRGRGAVSSEPPSRSTTPRQSVGSRPPSSLGVCGDDGMYMELCRCKAELNSAKLEIAILSKNQDAKHPTAAATPADNGAPSVGSEEHLTDITRHFTPQLRAALMSSSPRGAPRIAPQRPTRPQSARRPTI